MQSSVTVPQAFDAFVDSHEAGLRHALVGYFGWDLGRDAAAQAWLYGLEHWNRVSEMENPLGYLYRVGQRWGRNQRPRRFVWGANDSIHEHSFEPGLIPALKELPSKQRVCVVLRHGLDMDYAEIARLTNSSHAASRKNVERALSRLRQALEVTSA